MNDYKLPTTDLLKDEAINIESACELEMAEKLWFIKLIKDNGIRYSHIHALAGPTVTFYEITPDKDVSIVGIKRLEKKFVEFGIRIIAPISGKGTIGFEVFNEHPKLLYLRTLLEAPKFHESDIELPTIIGQAFSNEPFMVDLCKMRHLLLGGASGTGKSVCLHSIITSLLFKKLPSELKLVLIDPKQCEFGVYQKLENHYLAKLPEGNEPVVTSADKAVEVLSSLCLEMEDRFNRLMSANVRNIKEYNKKIRESIANSDEGNREMPYIVVAIDEYCDLILIKGKALEENIIRLAQRAHVVGIHLILSTQRTSCNVITGVIKANFPARIAFRVLTGVDSRTIIDRDGAQLLKGNGDMLFSANGQTDRIQGACISPSETERICEFIRQQPAQSEPYLLPISNNNEAFN